MLILIYLPYLQLVLAESSEWPKFSNPQTRYHWEGHLSHQVNLSDQDRQNLVETHNRIRNQAALGQLNQRIPSLRTETLTWDSELEKSAAAYAKYCNYRHSQYEDFTILLRVVELFS